MKYRKQSIRVLFFVFLLTCLLTGLAGIARVPASAAPQMQAATNIVISEFRTTGPNGGNDEFVEIYNPTSNSIPIGGWLLKVLTNSGSEATRATVLPGTNLGAGQHFLVQ
jgi:predicted extracellular nuclease